MCCSVACNSVEERARRATCPPEDRRRSGSEAETAACDYLEAKGMQVVKRNFRARGGEVDVVGREGDTLVFVEVRYREDDGLGTPEETVDRVKRLKVAAAARAYVSRIAPASWKEARFDVVAVVGTGPDRVIRHYPGAFDARGKLL